MLIMALQMEMLLRRSRHQRQSDTKMFSTALPAHLALQSDVCGLLVNC